MAGRNGFSQELVFAEGAVTAVILGIMQDGGLPHAGCRCERCVAAFNEPEKIEYAACLGLVDTRGAETAVYLFDATPDIKYQLNLLAVALGPHPDRPNRLRQPDGIFLTHAHMGHIAGLPQLGPEAMAVARLPVYASYEMGRLLQATPLWEPMLKNVRLVPLQLEQYVEVAQDIKITAVPVPHRDEWAVGTFAYKIEGPNRTLFYVPDIDRWEAWLDGDDMLNSVDVALVDASFYSKDELNGLNPVAHPLVPHTLKFFADLDCELVLTHFNHTNPVLDNDSQARSLVEAAGVQVAQTGQMFLL
ncbi:MAG: MBL fold metallo-hydrolase [Anaerolineae bacterium]|nr:MBL fold metallo-hydrolase [Anaerolineae bacterium]